MTIIVHTTASASARDYEWLKKSVASWLHRTDLGEVIPDYVVMAEQRINDDLRKHYLTPVTPLADTGGINWLIKKNPGMYLAATMCAALLYTRNTDEQMKWEAEYQRAANNLDLHTENSVGPLVLSNPTR